MRYLSLSILLLIGLSGYAQQYYLFVGTYTEGNFQNGTSKGIYVYRFDAATGNLSAHGNFVYAVNETDGAKPGGVSAFSFDKQTGRLTFLNNQASGGDDPCYVTVDKHRKWVMVANYGGGTYSALPILANGTLGAATETIRDKGTGPNKGRQEKAHVHSTILAPDEKYLAVCDLGTDKITVLRFNSGAARTPLVRDSAVSIQPS